MTDEWNFDTLKTEYLDKGGIAPARWVTDICLKLMEQLSSDENILILNSPIIICGDVHGQYEDVLELFQTAGIEKSNDFGKRKFLFMGDYVDRGYFSLNTFLLLAAAKLTYPDTYYLLRGNHESRQVTLQYGFYNEMVLNYGSSILYNLIMDVFDLFPYAAIVDNDLFAVHGGISPYMPLVSLIMNENRRAEIPSIGILADLTWSDPDEQAKDWRKNSRGAGYLFGRRQVDEFCHLNKINLITRSHQLAKEGYKWYFGPDKKKDISDETEQKGKLLLVWSAPNYAYRSNNMASILEYNGINDFDLEIFGARDSERRIKMKDGKVNNSPYFL